MLALTSGLVFVYSQATARDLTFSEPLPSQGASGSARTKDKWVCAFHFATSTATLTCHEVCYNNLKLATKDESAEQSTINQESLVPWLTSANSSSLTVTGHNMAAMLIVPKNRQSQGGRKEGSAVGGQSALAAIY
ncbi:hypothetical protein PoB_001338100 [Plakobranchus ocellatus]|uniref:Uncharacterized protein n=1 Tax=Plakobranchus ocellatus TaxID=259542 RepID=A0AAV3YWX3_9GAST|nr:hypothetical protein PoB_001338100 [Plakobranchus ocellatus]